MSTHLIKGPHKRFAMPAASGAFATLEEIRRRRVFRAAVAYGVVAWIVLQVAEVTFEPLQVPAWVMTALVIGAILAFPVVLVLSWAYDITVQGLVRTDDSPASAYDQRKIALVISLIVVASVTAAGYSLYRYYARNAAFGVAVQAVAADAHSVAVLPFADFSESGDQVYFGDGIAEELLNVLSRVPGLRVAARTSSFAYRDTQKSIGEIAADLGVTHIVEGSVRKSGDRVRVTAQLINAQTGFHLWSRTFDRTLDDIFVIQNDIAQAIASAMSVAVGGGQALAMELPPAQRGAQSVQAYDPYLQGLEQLHQRTPDSLRLAIQHFDAAIAADPEYASAYAALSKAWVLSTIYGGSKLSEAIQKAQAAANRAIILAPKSADAHAAHGLIRLQAGQMSAAEKALRRAIALNPNDAMAHSWLGNVLMFTQRSKEALGQHQRAYALNPKHPVTVAALSSDYLQRGRYQDAIEILKKALGSGKGDALLLQTMASAADAFGHLDDAVVWAHGAIDLDPRSPLGHALLAEIYLDLGMVDAAARRVATAIRIAPDNLRLIRVSVLLELARGSNGRALKLLERVLAHANSIDLPENHLVGLKMMAGGIADLLGEYDQALSWVAENDMQSDGMMEYKVDGNLVLAHVLMQMGSASAAKKALKLAAKSIEEHRAQGLSSPESMYMEAVYLALSGQSVAAVEALGKSVEFGYSKFWMLQLDKRLDSIRQTAGFERALNVLADRLSKVSERVVASA